MASVVDTSVKRFAHNFPGAPTSNGTAGNHNVILYACLCTGFGTRTANSVSVSGGVCTITLPTDSKNNNMLHSVITVSGASGAYANMNGEQKITATSATELKFATNLPDGSVSGTVSIMTSPAGWERVFYNSSADVAVYRSLSQYSTRRYLRVDDSSSQFALVRGYNSMTDVNTGQGEFPAITDAPSGFYWQRNYTTSASTNPLAWDFFADDRFFVFSPSIYNQNGSGQYLQNPVCFGDFIGDATTSVYDTLIQGNSGNNTDISGGVFYAVMRNESCVAIAKPLTGLGVGHRAYLWPECGSGSDSMNDLTLGYWPSLGGKTFLYPYMVMEKVSRNEASASFRGYAPALLHCPQRITSYNPYPHGAFFKALNGRTIMPVRANYVGSGASTEASAPQKGFIDVQGPWF